MSVLVHRRRTIIPDGRTEASGRHPMPPIDRLEQTSCPEEAIARAGPLGARPCIAQDRGRTMCTWRDALSKSNRLTVKVDNPARFPCWWARLCSGPAAGETFQLPSMNNSKQWKFGATARGAPPGYCQEVPGSWSCEALCSLDSAWPQIESSMVNTCQSWS